MRIFVILLVLAGLGVGGWFGYQHWWGSRPTLTYQTVELKTGRVIATVSATGTIEPLVKVLVGSQVSGTVMTLNADFNDFVDANQVLATLDQDRFKAVVAQRVAAVQVAQARVDELAAHLTSARLDRERIEQAFNRQVSSDFELQTARADEAAAAAALEGAKAQLAASQADKQQAQVDLDKTVIRAPIAGVIISRDVDAGQTVAASLSAPTLFTLANDLTKMRVTAAVSETDIGKVREKMSVEFHVDAYPEKRFHGVVSQVRYAQTVVDNVVTYQTLIDVDNPERLLRPGMTAVCQFEVARSEGVLVVPNAALRYDPLAPPPTAGPGGQQRGGAPPVAEFGAEKAPRIFRLHDGLPEEIKVELGLTDGRMTEVKSATLKAGDPIVTSQQTGTERSAAVRRLLGR